MDIRKMKKKRREQKKLDKQDTVSPITDRRALEKSQSDIHRLLREREFDSVEEMNEYLQSIIQSETKRPSLPAKTPLEEA